MFLCSNHKDETDHTLVLYFENDGLYPLTSMDWLNGKLPHLKAIGVDHVQLCNGNFAECMSDVDEHMGTFPWEGASCGVLSDTTTIGLVLRFTAEVDGVTICWDMEMCPGYVSEDEDLSQSDSKAHYTACVEATVAVCKDFAAIMKIVESSRDGMWSPDLAGFKTHHHDYYNDVHEECDPSIESLTGIDEYYDDDDDEDAVLDVLREDDDDEALN